MKYYLLILFGAVIGYAVCAVMAAARDDPAPPRRCGDCAHSKPIPENARFIFRDNELSCTALRGVYYDFPDGVAVVKEDAFCDEFCPDGNKEGVK